MGSTSAAIKRKGRGLEFYKTPKAATRALIKRVSICGRIVEPCVGDGAIRTELADPAPPYSLDYEFNPNRKILTNDIDRKVKANYHRDATLRSTWDKIADRGEIDWSVTNPPFSLAPLILPLAFEYSFVAVAFLLRITYLEPCGGREDWLARYPPHRVIVLPRISFKTVIRRVQVKGKWVTRVSRTDSATVAWMVWYKFPAERLTEVVRREEMRYLVGSGR